VSARIFKAGASEPMRGHMTYLGEGTGPRQCDAEANADKQPFGHRTYIGKASRRQIDRRPVPIGHRRYVGTRSVTCIDMTSEALRKRAQWSLYADCDRAPLGWETKL
jgi:hypothetical protein